MFKKVPRPLRSIAILDFITWLIVVPLALYIRLIDAVIRWSYSRLIFVAIFASITQLIVGYLFGLYRGRYRFASFDEARGVLVVVSIVSLVPTIPPFIDNSIAPRSFGFLCFIITLFIQLSYRFVFRTLKELRNRNRVGNFTLIYGAGEAGIEILRQANSAESSEFKVIGFLDDDTSKQLLKISGLSVLGTERDLASLITSYEIKTVIVAIRNLELQKINRIYNICSELHVNVARIPTLSELVNSNFELRDLEAIAEEDLIGRKVVVPDESAISGMLLGKRILITGAGGSIGSEISKQVRRYNPESIFMLDRDESLLHGLQLTLEGQGLLTSENYVLADIRDSKKIEEVFRILKPDIVFHAAALKHLPMLERYPEEAYKTNFEGTKNVLSAALSSGTKIFVNISTDKAVNPTSVLGLSKQKAEELVSEYAKEAEASSRYLSVRFGNVLGSRGSVLETFRHQIKNNLPITITHPEVKRYFMTIPEAVHLVLEASAFGANGDILMLDMGEPVYIEEIAKKLIKLSGKSIEIVYTGLRKGEKLNEDLSKSGFLFQVKENNKLKKE